MSSLWSSVALLKRHLKITTDAENARLLQFVEEANAAAQTYIGRRYETASYTEYYDGHGQGDIFLRQNPVATVDHIFLDPQGYAGKGANAFASTTELTAGTDYFATLEDSGGIQLGRLRWIRNVNLLVADNAFLGLGDDGSGAGWWSGLNATPSPNARFGWPDGLGNIKVQYTTLGTVPLDVVLAVNQIAAFIRLTAQTGGLPKGSERLGEYGYSLLAGAHGYGASAEMMSVCGLLARYRRRVVA